MIPSIQQIDQKLEESWEQRGKDTENELHIARIAHQESLAIKYEMGVAVSHFLIGDAFVRKNKFPEAIESLDKARLELSNLPHNEWHIRLHFAYGALYLRVGVFDKSLEHFLEALQLAKALNHESLTLHAEGNIGVIYWELEQYDKVVEYSLRMLAATEHSDDHRMRFTLYLNLAGAYHFTGDHQAAVEMAKLALMLATTNQEKLSAHGNLGVAYTDIGDYGQAKYHLEKSLELARTSCLQMEQSVCIVDLADYHIKIDEGDRATELLLDGLTIACSIDFKRGIKDCHQRLYMLYRKQEQWERALYHHEQLYEVDQTIFNDKSDARIRNLEVLHNVERLRETNKRQQRKFDQLTYMKNTLLSDFSHDLKNPLGTITMVLGLARLAAAQQENNTNEYLDYLDKIDSNVERMTQLITDVLDIARLDTGLGVDLQRTYVGDVISKIYTQLRGQAQSKDIELTCNYEDGLYVLADMTAIHRALENIVSNAIKYTTTNGSMAIEAGGLTTEEVFIRVKDTGVGIPKEELPKVFDRFYRVSTHKQTVDGTGLGLTIAKNIVDMHNGRIEVESEINQGTTFTIVLPRA